MKKKFLGILGAAAMSFHVDAQDLGHIINRLSLTILPTIPTYDGTFSSYGIGFSYNDKVASEIRLNIDEKRINEKFSGIENSLNAVDRIDWKWFFVPVQYSFFRSEYSNFSAGLGIHHYRHKLNENGYFHMESLVTPVNAYINNFSMNITGLIVETEFSHVFSEYFKITVKSGLMPFSFLNATQTVDIYPLFAYNFTQPFSHSQSNNDAFSVDGKITMSILKYVDISGAYYGSFHTFDIVDFDADFNVLASSKKTYSHSFQIEGILKYDFSESFSVNLGIGGIFNSVYLDSALATEGKRLYFVFGGKKSYL